jgi:hypothetical protein
MQQLNENTQSNRDRTILWSHRDIPLSHSKHLCGRVPWSPPTQSVPVESDLEANALDLLMHQPFLRAVHAQPFTLVINIGGKRHRYTPDFLVVYDRLSRWLRRQGFDRWTVIEIKPAALLARDREKILARLQFVRDCLGLAALVLTERELITGRA